MARGGAVAARWAHNPKVVGSNPTPATKKEMGSVNAPFFITQSDVLLLRNANIIVT